MSHDFLFYQVQYILNLYEEMYEAQLAIPVVKGRKTMKEKWYSAEYTTTVEAYVAVSGRGIQVHYSHILVDKMFLQFLDNMFLS